MGVTCSAHGGDEKLCIKFLVGKPEWKRPLGRPRRGWEDNIIIDFRKIGLENFHRIRMAQDSNRWRALVSTVMNLRVP
jgi:hypothetical protein